MSRTRKDAPERVQLRRGGHGRPVRRTRGAEPGEAYFPLRFNVAVHKSRLRLPTLQERTAVRESVRPLVKASRAAETVTDIDDSGVELRQQKRDAFWGGGYFD